MNTIDKDILHPWRDLSFFQVTVAVTVVGLLYIIVKPLLIHQPLDAIPGPWIARWTNLQLKFAVLAGDRVHHVHKLHASYGPIVRISPSEIAVADPEATKAIHKIGSGFLKSPWYQKLNKSEHPGIFVMLNVKDHATRRRLLAQSFSKSNLLKWEDLVREKTDLTISQIRKEATQSGQADILKWFTFMATDLIGQLSFGDSFRMLEYGQKNEYIEDLESVMMLSGISAELSPVVSVLSMLPIPAMKRISNVHIKLKQYGTESIQRHKSQALSGELTDHPTFFSKMFEAGKSQVLSDAEIEQEASNLIVAGSDTTAVTMTYLIWAVLTHPEVHRRLLVELESLSDPYTSEDVSKLQYLNATIQETLRLYGAAPGGLPRIVPPGGRDIGGYLVPEGTTVTTQAYTLHRDPEIFADPNHFSPDRWLNPTPQMEEAFMPFGAGSRICIGLHLARLEILLASVTFLRSFPTARISSNTSDADMAMENYFLIVPKAHKCFVSL